MWIFSSFQSLVECRIQYYLARIVHHHGLLILRYSIATPLPHSYPNVQREVMESRRVTAILEIEEAQNPNLSKSQLIRKLVRYYSEIRATFSWFICKICGYLLYKVFRRLMSHLLVSPEQMKRLSEAEKTGTPLVYLPLHRSHLDYLLITWTAWHFGLRLPYIASGDNLNLSGLGGMQNIQPLAGGVPSFHPFGDGYCDPTGAFFIRRRVNVNDNRGKDASYRAILHSYIEQLLKKGLSIEFFLEGTRCRFGKCQLPKHGLISNVIQAVQQKTISDCYLVPVSYTYDNVAEGVFLDELTGIPKKRESVFGVLLGVLKSFGKPKRCGAVRLHFGNPVLLSDYLIALQRVVKSHDLMPQLGRVPRAFPYRELIPWHSGHTVSAFDRNLLRAIGYHVVYEAQSMASISLVSVVSALLMCKFRVLIECNLAWTRTLGGLAMYQVSAAVLLDIRLDKSGTNSQTTERTERLVSLEAGRSHWMSYLLTVNGSVIRLFIMVPMLWVGAWEKQAVKMQSNMPLRYLGDSVVRYLDLKTREDRLMLRRTHRHLISLAYYKNALVPLFALQSATLHSSAIGCSLKSYFVSRVRTFMNLSLQLLVKKVGQMQNGLLKSQENDEDLTVGDYINVEVSDPVSRYRLLFYSNFLRPFVQSLYIVVDRLLLSDLPIEESDLVRNWCQFCATSAYKTPFPLLLEAVNSDSFRNSLLLLRQKGILSEDLTWFQRQEGEKNARYSNEIVDY
ncbi:Acyltransferase [Parelaphostrongylus tenuis]|uniref:Acyltransferase n=1 Tax=Parelaphostrongylus tenuis TaxID=148309 RepID=A0AAD5QK85_PARTN|nr:Acyltransferase [Parelaphostrongylus tenuis]